MDCCAFVLLCCCWLFSICCWLLLPVAPCWAVCCSCCSCCCWFFVRLCCCCWWWCCRGSCCRIPGGLRMFQWGTRLVPPAPVECWFPVCSFSNKGLQLEVEWNLMCFGLIRPQSRGKTRKKPPRQTMIDNAFLVWMLCFRSLEWSQSFRFFFSRRLAVLSRFQIPSKER